MKCPDCGQYSLTYDFARNGWQCHVYNGFIPDEHMPWPSSGPLLRLHHALGQIIETFRQIGVFG